jgi:hypothetical protein
MIAACLATSSSTSPTARRERLRQVQRHDGVFDQIKKLGDYVWYTGVIEHATMTDCTAASRHSADDADVVKGRAGSPYANVTITTWTRLAVVVETACRNI